MNLICVTYLLSFLQYFGFNRLFVSAINQIGSTQKLSLNDLAITIKTTHKYHKTRVIDILDTWLNEAPSNTYFVSDTSNDRLNQKLKGRLIVTNCGRNKHDHASLNCKMRHELELLSKINAKWSCHFDDDNYVNIPQLLETLAKYDHNQPVYIGRPSLDKPVKIGDAEFSFGTGGAGLCFSRPLIRKIYPYIKRFESVTPRFVAPDDVTLGYLITQVLQIPLTIESKFHSHLHTLTSNQLKQLHKQASLGPTNAILRHLNFIHRNNLSTFHAIDCHIYPQKCY